MSYEARCIVEMLNSGTPLHEVVRAIQQGLHMKPAHPQIRSRRNRPTVEIPVEDLAGLVERTAA